MDVAPAAAPIAIPTGTAAATYAAYSDQRFRVESRLRSREPRCSAAGCVLERQTLKPGFSLDMF
jgi:hypothetical protein